MSISTVCLEETTMSSRLAARADWGRSRIRRQCRTYLEGARAPLLHLRAVHQVPLEHWQRMVGRDEDEGLGAHLETRLLQQLEKNQEDEYVRDLESSGHFMVDCRQLLFRL